MRNNRRLIPGNFWHWKTQQIACLLIGLSKSLKRLRTLRCKVGDLRTITVVFEIVLQVLDSPTFPMNKNSELPETKMGKQNSTRKKAVIVQRALF